MGCSDSKAANAAEEPVSVPPVESKTVESHKAEPVKLSDVFIPEIGYVLKTKKQDDAKVFINVFHHSCVLYIVAADSPKSSADKAGEPTLTYDVAINTAVFTICANNDDSKELVSEQIIIYLNKTLLHPLSLEFKIPKMKRGYVGEDIPKLKNPPSGVKERLITAQPEDGEAVIPVITASTVAAASEAASAEIAKEEKNSVTRTASSLSAVVTGESRTTAELNSNALTAAVEAAASGEVPHVTTNNSTPVRSTLPTPGVTPKDKEDSASVAVNVSGPSTAPKPPMTFSGYALKKSGSKFVGLQTRFFVLSEHGIISYYQTKEDHSNHVKPKGKFNLNDVDKAVEMKSSATLISSTDPLVIEIPVKDTFGTRVYEIHCENEVLAKSWSEIIFRHIQLNDDNDD